MGFSIIGGFSIISNPLGSVSLNGTTQYLSAPGNAAFGFGTGDFTVEAWINLNNVSATKGLFFGVGTNSFGLRIGQSYAGNVNGLNIVKSGVADLEYCVFTFSTGTWYHIAVVRIGTTIYFFVNGTQQTTLGSGGGSFNFTTPSSEYIGSNNDTNEKYAGYISNLRVVKGVGVYSGNFTVPTAPLLGVQSSGTNISAITGTQTSLLLNTPNNSEFITDSSANQFTITNTGTATAASLTPFAAGSGGWQFTSLPVTPTVEYLVVAGGAGGGGTGVGAGIAAGGGAGGFLTGTSLSVTSGISYTVTVGAGGAGGASKSGSPSGTFGNIGTNGSNSSISGSGITTITSAGGGGGSPGQDTGISGAAGGSGGGGGGGGTGTAPGITAGAGNTPSTSPSQGNSGGSGAPGSGAPNYGAGGGGGAGAVGTAGSTTSGGAGGAGTASSISGSSVTYAGGGGGSAVTTAGAGGTGGGGNGSNRANSPAATAGTANTGGGGGGAGADTTSAAGGNGGSGIVIIAYPNTYSDLSSVGAGLTCNGSAGNTTPDTASRSGYKVYRFTAGTGTISW